MGRRLRSNRRVGRVELLGSGGRGRRTTFQQILRFGLAVVEVAVLPV